MASFAGCGCFVTAPLALVQTSRMWAQIVKHLDSLLADAPDLDYTMVAEILLLIETLEKRGL